ncbi:hypothetical protein R1sor_000366 [Riccia sorocarpa]|uniref:starch synthase n=1 Tax=Riccia sorocarpa TaxID=122646 RepID=A0ABD3GWW1_9MARC
MHIAAEMAPVAKVGGLGDVVTGLGRSLQKKGHLLEIILPKYETDMIHTHDWQTAVVAPLYWDSYVHQGLDYARLAFTCHNFEYQGVDAPGALASCGLNVPQLHLPDRMQDNFAHDRVNFIKVRDEESHCTVDTMK